ncbi:MAG TPA: SAM-dependent chlorinase/fluorinase [Trichocoleus sp.]
MAPVITLLSDFGLRDAYVGVMKGVIAQLCPEASVIDLTHEIPPQDLLAARFNLLNAYPYFPEGTVHLAVVDPGVGTSRRGIAAQTEKGWLVGPDNGIFSGIWQVDPPLAAVALTRPEVWRSPTASTTFHGRDIFAPVAARLARGEPLNRLGEALAPERLVRLDLPPVTRQDNQVQGCVQYCDRFGNLITNLLVSDLPSTRWVAEIAGQTLPSAQTYGEVAVGQPLALVGSHGWVEIAVNGGSAQQHLQTAVGAPVALRPVE